MGALVVHWEEQSGGAVWEQTKHCCTTGTLRWGRGCRVPQA